MDELNKKLAEWAGWHWEKNELANNCFALILLAPDEELVKGYIGYIPDHTPNFTKSLDACFKWLMDLVKEKLGGKGILQVLNSLVYRRSYG